MRLNSSLTFPEWYLIIQTLFLVIMLFNDANSCYDYVVLVMNEWMNECSVGGMIVTGENWVLG